MWEWSGMVAEPAGCQRGCLPRRSRVVGLDFAATPEEGRREPRRMVTCIRQARIRAYDQNIRFRPSEPRRALPLVAACPWRTRRLSLAVTEAAGFHPGLFVVLTGRGAVCRKRAALPPSHLPFRAGSSDRIPAACSPTTCAKSRRGSYTALLLPHFPSCRTEHESASGRHP